jgi:N-acetylglucosamine kinase-like BadF-type ATPase
MRRRSRTLPSRQPRSGRTRSARARACALRHRSARVRKRAPIALFAGIDGGQSSTVAAIGDERGLIARGSGPPADLVGEPRDSIRQAAALDAALAAALEAARLDAATHFDVLVAGISGFDGELSARPALTARANRITFAHDTAIAHEGALGGAAGIVAIAGTGSVALGNAAPGAEFVRCGGWGYFFGDEGSAIWIARNALRVAMLREDRGEPGALGARAQAFYGTNSLRAIQHAFAHGDISRPALAAFASDVFECAADGDRDATRVRDAAAAELAALVATVDRRLDETAVRLVSYAGGLFQSAPFLEAFGEALEDALPTANLVAPAEDPASGALALARKSAMP